MDGAGQGPLAAHSWICATLRASNGRTGPIPAAARTRSPPPSRPAHRSPAAAGNAKTRRPARNSGRAPAVRKPTTEHGGHRNQGIAGATQAEAAADIEAIEELEAAANHNNVAAWLSTAPVAASSADSSSGSSHGPASASSTPMPPMRMAAITITYDPTHGPVAIAGADGLADQRGSRLRHPHARHVGDGGEGHDQLGGRTLHRAQAYLHQLKQRNADQIRGTGQAHGESQSELGPQGDARGRHTRWVR